MLNRLIFHYASFIQFSYFHDSQLIAEALVAVVPVDAAPSSDHGMPFFRCFPSQIASVPPTRCVKMLRTGAWRGGGALLGKGTRGRRRTRSTAAVPATRFSTQRAILANTRLINASWQVNNAHFIPLSLLPSLTHSTKKTSLLGLVCPLSFVFLGFLTEDNTHSLSNHSSFDRSVLELTWHIIIRIKMTNPNM